MDVGFGFKVYNAEYLELLKYERELKEQKELDARVLRALSEDISITNISKLYTVKGSTGNSYVCSINGDSSSCTCPDYINRQKGKGEKCKHLLFIELMVTTEERPSCPYGKDCNRVNLFHKKEYKH